MFIFAQRAPADTIGQSEWSKVDQQDCFFLPS